LQALQEVAAEVKKTTFSFSFINSMRTSHRGSNAHLSERRGSNKPRESNKEPVARENSKGSNERAESRPRSWWRRTSDMRSSLDKEDGRQGSKSNDSRSNDSPSESGSPRSGSRGVSGAKGRSGSLYKDTSDSSEALDFASVARKISKVNEGVEDEDEEHIAVNGVLISMRPPQTAASHTPASHTPATELPIDEPIAEELPSVSLDESNPTSTADYSANYPDDQDALVVSVPSSADLDTVAAGAAAAAESEPQALRGSTSTGEPDAPKEPPSASSLSGGSGRWEKRLTSNAV